ncbi:MAG TPA: hypothetical protein VIA18_08405 [Polyangia bacterium]|nr:hypothetical protein [Polyangia bacterium]
MLGGCTEKPAYLYGEDLSGVQFKFYNATEGIYPDTSVLQDPNNPFKSDPCSDQAPDGGIAGKWQIQGSTKAGPVVAFYCWATLMASAANGETQYYVGFNLQQIFQSGRVTDPTTQGQVAALGVAAYTSVLLNFPAAVTYDSTGMNASELATPSCEGIFALSGKLPAGWTLITDPMDTNFTNRCVQQ